MKNIKQALSNIIEGNLDEMRQNFSSALMEKAVQKLEEKKIEIGQSYFAQLSEQVSAVQSAQVSQNSPVMATRPFGRTMMNPQSQVPAARTVTEAKSKDKDSDDTNEREMGPAIPVRKVVARKLKKA